MTSPTLVVADRAEEETRSAKPSCPICALSADGDTTKLSDQRNRASELAASQLAASQLAASQLAASQLAASQLAASQLTASQLAAS
jgi:hypothetical protein